MLRTDDQATGVAAALTLTSRHLPNAPAHLLRCLGRHATTTITLAEATTLTGLPAAEVREAFRTLEACHLLTELPGDRYVTTGLTHLYARDLARRPEVTDLPVRRIRLAVPAESRETRGEIPAQRPGGRRANNRPPVGATSP